MLKFLFFSALVLAAVTIGAPIFFPLLLIFGVIWLITLPFKDEAKPRTINVEVA